MTRNIGAIDSVIRAVISLALLYIGFISDSIVVDPLSRNIIAFIGVIGLIIVTVGVCPLYSLAGIHTCTTKDK